MRHPKRKPSPGLLTSGLLGALALALLGCANAPRPKPRAALTVYAPCVIAWPIREVVNAYAAAHPEVDLTSKTDIKPLALLAKVKEAQKGPAAVITMGEVEMQWLVKGGAVEAADVRTIAVNTYPLVVVASAKGARGVRELRDLAGPAAKSIYVEDPSQSSLGDRTERAFGKLGLWEGIASKVVRPDPDAMVPAELIAGKADAAVVFRDCLLGERGEGASPPKTLRIIGEIPEETYAEIPYQAAGLKQAPRAEVAREFVEFLVSAEGRQALQRAGLKPR